MLFIAVHVIMDRHAQCLWVIPFGFKIAFTKLCVKCMSNCVVIIQGLIVTVLLWLCGSAVNSADKQQDIPPTVGVDLELHC